MVVPAALADVTEVPGDAGFVIAGSRTDSGFGIVRIRSDEDNNGTYETITSTLIPYGTAHVTDGVRVATGDFDGDGNDELVVSAGNGLPVQIYDLGPDGTVGGLMDSAVVFGSRGVFVAAGDINADGRDELVVGAAAKKPPTVRIYSDTDNDGKVLDNLANAFNAFPSTFRGGVTVAMSNTNNSGGEEVITGQASLGRKITIWTDTDADRQVSDGPPLESLNAYGSSFKGGVSIASWAFDGIGGGGGELVYAPAHGKGAVTIRTDTNANGLVGDNPAFETFKPYGSGYGGGVRLAAADTDHSGFFAELVTAPATLAQKRSAKIYDDTADPGFLLHDNALDQAFKPMPTSVKLAGSYLAVGVVRTSVYTYPGSPQSIPDSATLTSEFWVPASAGKIRDLDVFINLFHSFDGDLDVTLTQVATGTAVVLFTDVGGSNEGFDIRLNDEAGTDIGTASNPKPDGPISGTFNPEGAALLSAFDNVDASGLWRLTIADDSAADTGTLFSWGLVVTY
jgi:subtilisin-like proprotein convertase family protein